MFASPWAGWAAMMELAAARAWLAAISERGRTVERAIGVKDIVGLDGEFLGTAGPQVETHLGRAVLVQRADELGGGTIVLPARQLEDRGDRVIAPYGRLSMREAPPYSANVPLAAYLRYWERLGASDVNQSESSYLPTGSGPVTGPESDLADEQIAARVKQRLRRAPGVVANPIKVTVSEGTVLLEGEQNDTEARLAAAQAAAAVPGVREIVNMLVVRAV